MDTVKDIKKRYLKRNFYRPDLKGLKVIDIDEFTPAKGHVYNMIVVNLKKGQVVYANDV